jgi:CRISPR-associated protein Csx16
MVTYFVSRHPGAVEWAARRGIEAEPVEHLDPKQIDAGDTVIGTLPVHLVAEINARGGRYLHLELDVPAERRGEELSADQMDSYGAELQEFRVELVKS